MFLFHYSVRSAEINISKRGDFCPLSHELHLITAPLTSPTPICLMDSAAKGMKRNKSRSVTQVGFVTLSHSPVISLCVSFRPAPCSALKTSSLRPEPEGESCPLKMDNTQRMESPVKKDSDRRPMTPVKPDISRSPSSPASPVSRSKRGKRARDLIDGISAIKCLKICLSCTSDWYVCYQLVGFV